MLNRSAAIFDKRTMAHDDQDLDHIVDDVQDDANLLKTKIIFLKGGAASKERKQGGCEVELKKVK